jgi:stage V sporulation protein D (sporulation-specific penicillin-binding protein)
MQNRRSGKFKSLDRTGLLIVVFFVIGALIVGRLFYIQVLLGKYFVGAADDQHKIEQVLLQRRGEVYMQASKDGGEVPVVINKALSLVYAVPTEITNPRQTAKVLASILYDPGGQCNELLPEKASEELILKCEERKSFEDGVYDKVVKDNDPYEPIEHNVDESVVDHIKARNLDGIYFEEEWVRFYPESEATAHISGFLGFRDNVRTGQYGIEGYWNVELAGEAGKLYGDKDLFGRIIPVSSAELVEATDGVSVLLTIDKVVQNKAYEIIKKAIEDYGAEYGSIIVMDPSNGEIKAMAGYPSFDPNDYGQIDNIEVYKNMGITGAYEPGSIFKIITMAIGLDTGAVEADSMFFDEGFVRLGDHTIRNADNEVFGEVNMTEVLENSINSGAVHVAFEAGNDEFRKYVEKFGFGKPVGISLDGESWGDISSLDKKGDIYTATASYGQGITITPMQMVQAMSAVVNGGQMIEPRIIKSIDGNSVATEEKGKVISEKTSQILKAMLVSVVKNGHGGNAQVEGYYIGGKTGTAEIASSGGGYSNENNHSFVGFGPLSQTKFVIMVRLSKPEWGRFSAVTAAPTFQKMAEFLLQYYQIPPEYSI